MSIALKQVLSSVESLIKNINERKNFILKQINAKPCVSSAEMTFILNSFVDQLVESNDIKPDLQELRRSLETDPHKGFKDEINKYEQMNRELKSRVDDLQNSLNIEISLKNALRKLYTECDKSHVNNETQLKDRIKGLEMQIEKYKELEKELKELKESKDNMNNEVLNDGKSELSERTLRELCLTSKPYVVIDSIEVIKEVINIENSFSFTKVEINSDNESINGSEDMAENEDLDGTEVEEVVDSDMSRKYHKMETRSATKSNWNKMNCKFETTYERDMCRPIQTHVNDNIEESFRCKTSSVFACDYPKCNKSYVNKHNLNRHLRQHHRRANKYSKRQKSIKRELIEDLLDFH